MLLQELKEQAFKLPPSDQFELVNAILSPYKAPYLPNLAPQRIFSANDLMQYKECEAY